jgi:steroid 5-alpha reductase family enzyme
MSFAEILGIAACALLICLTILWLISLALKNASIVDVFWGLGFILAGWIYFACTPNGFVDRKWLVNTLVTIGGLRLALYIFWRNHGKGEDFRYKKFREEAGAGWWWRSFFKVFLLQGALIVILTTPLLVAQVSAFPNRITAFDIVGIIVWLIGFFFEAVGDVQMARFKANSANRGKVMDSGLWRYTRHPNYFGEAMMWWGYFLIAAAAGAYWTIYSPALMTLLLLRVSGVNLLEKTLQEVKPGYREYQASTSAFVPWFPRRRKPVTAVPIDEFGRAP